MKRNLYIALVISIIATTIISFVLYRLYKKENKEIEKKIDNDVVQTIDDIKKASEEAQNQILEEARKRTEKFKEFVGKQNDDKEKNDIMVQTDKDDEKQYYIPN